MRAGEAPASARPAASRSALARFRSRTPRSMPGTCAGSFAPLPVTPRRARARSLLAGGVSAPL